MSDIFKLKCLMWIGIFTVLIALQSLTSDYLIFTWQFWVIGFGISLQSAAYATIVELKK